MTADERTIAESAVTVRGRNTYESVYSEVAKRTGVEEQIVRETIERLAGAAILHKHGGPAHTVPGPDVGKVAEAWYDKGQCWPKD